MSGWQRLDVATIEPLCVRPEMSLGDAMARLKKTAMRILLVVEPSHQLLGTLTDSDIRRAILAGRSLDDRVACALNRSPIAISENDETRGIERLKSSGNPAAPVVDAAGRVLGLVRVDVTARRVALVLTGGRGSRLGALTQNTPKPLLEVGGKPLLGHLLDNLAEGGFGILFVAVHHLAEQIMEFLDKNRPPGIDIRHLRETTPLGTAGALGALPSEIVEPVLVTNGDLATRTNFGAMVEFHAEHRAQITIGCTHYRHQIPFGVVETDGGAVTRIVEKPSVTHFVNAGLYVLDPAVFRLVGKNQRIDMPDLVNMALDAGLAASTFPIVETWIDVGRPEQLADARDEFSPHATHAMVPTDADREKQAN